MCENTGEVRITSPREERRTTRIFMGDRAGSGARRGERNIF
jgi:hypothetical protein